MSGVGGYVRRSERKPYYEPRRLGMPRFEVFYQSMPVLRFEPFDVEEPLDSSAMPALRSNYGKRHRTKRHH